jgi:tetratricopeptide (TPR) repeat protein
MPMPATPPAPSAQAAAEPAKRKGERESAPVYDLASGERAGLGSAGVGTGGGGQLRAGSGGALGSPGVAASARSVARDQGALTEEPLPGAVVALPVWVRRVDARLHQASGVDAALAAKVLRGSLASQARACYPGSGSAGSVERLTLEFGLSDKGTVSSVFVSGGRLGEPRAQACVLAAAERLRFPKPESGRASIQAGLEFSMASVAPQSTQRVAQTRAARPRPAAKTPRVEDAYDGALAQVLEALGREDKQTARTLAEAAHTRDPGDVMALVALGEALEAQGEHARAARAYGSLIDLFPSRTDLRRMAGARLERLPREHGLALAADTYEKALQQRPDHPSAHRLAAFALLKQGKYERAFDTLERAVNLGFRWDRFEGAERILREDLQLVASAWARADESATARVQERLARLGLTFDGEPSLRFVLNWETDANDVDFHIYDGRGGHAYYMQPKLGSGGQLYADITSGYGPECFAIRGKRRAYPYVLQAHYFARGPMGYGMGKLQVVEHDGKGSLQFSEHPFAIMKDKAFVQLAVHQGHSGAPGVR